MSPSTNESPSATSEMTLPAASPEISTWSATGTRRRYRSAAVAMVGLMLGGMVLAACGDDDDEDGDTDAKGATASCATLPAADTASILPSDFPLPAGAVAYKHAAQGKTMIEYIHVAGTSTTITATRDAEISLLTAAGYKKDGGDQEEGHEADADISGPHSGNVNVRAADDCAGYLTIRITLTD